MEQQREKGGLKPDTHKHWPGVWLLLRTQPGRARFPRHNGLAQTKTFSRLLVTGCGANTGNGALSGTGHNDSSRKKGRKPEKERSPGSVWEGGHAAPLAPQTWAQEWPLHSPRGGSPRSAPSTPACLSAPPSTLTRRGRATRADSRAHTRSPKETRPPSERSDGGAAPPRRRKKERRNSRLLLTLSTFGCKCRARALTHALCRCSIFSRSPPTGGGGRREAANTPALTASPLPLRRFCL